MRRALALLMCCGSALAACASPGPAAGQVLSSAPSALPAPASPCLNDGHAAAPAGATIMYAARKASWAFPPACQTPDVDYAVGPDGDCAACVSPAAAVALLGLPSVTYDAARNFITCDTGPSGIVLQNVDFRLGSGSGGGIQVGGADPGHGCNNFTIRNVRIVMNPSVTGLAYPIRQMANSNTIHITKTWIDGNGLVGAAEGLGEIIYLTGSGLQSITYTRVINAAEHNVTFGCVAAAVCTSYERYNSFSAQGFAQGAHMNGVQWLGTFAASDVSYNFWYNPQPSIALEAGAGLTIDTSSGVASATLHFSGVGAQTSLLPGMSLTSANLQAATTILAVPAPTNPVTVSLSLAATATASGTAAAIPNAYPGGNVNAIRYANQNATAQMLNGTMTGNVFDGDGPIKPGNYALSCGGDGTGLEINGMVMTSNYYNPAGYSGAFYLTQPYCLNATGSANKRLDTGATIPVP